VNVQASADFTDMDGVRRRLVFPRPIVEVLAASPSPSPPAPTPTAGTPAPPYHSLCGRGPCNNLTVHAFLDARCDRRWNPGPDQGLGGTTIQVRAGDRAAAVTAGPSGVLLFTLPRMDAVVRVTFPAELHGRLIAACSNSPMQLLLPAREFGQQGHAYVQFRARESR
jgi:hypothetical protein